MIIIFMINGRKRPAMPLARYNIHSQQDYDYNQLKQVYCEQSLFPVNMRVLCCRNKSEDHAVDSEPAAGPPPQPQRHHLALRAGRRLRHPRHGALRPAVGRGEAQHQHDLREALPRHALLLPQRRAGDGARAAADLQVRGEHGGLESSGLGRSQL